MLYGCLFCAMSPGTIGSLLSHIGFYVEEWAEYYRTAHPGNSARYATKSDNIHHVGIVRCWVGGRQKHCRIGALRDMPLAHSADPVEHAALWRFAFHVAVEIQDHEAYQWKGRHKSIAVSWWDQAVLDVMAGTTTTTAVIRQSRVYARVPTIGKVLVPFDERNFMTDDDDLEFGKSNAQRHAPLPEPRQDVPHDDFRNLGDSNEIVNKTTAATKNMVTNMHSTFAVPSSQHQHRMEVVPASLDKYLRPRGPVPSPAPLPAQSLVINNDSDTFNLRSHPMRTRKRGDRSGSTVTEYDENQGNEAYRPPQTRTRRVQADDSVVNKDSDNDSNSDSDSDSDSDIPASKKRATCRTAPPATLTLHVNVFGKLVSVPVTLYSTLNNIIAAALAGASVRSIHAHAIHGSEPVVRFDRTSFMLIDQWCVVWDEKIWECIKEKVPCLPHPVVWNCQLVEVRTEKDGLAGKA